MKERVYKIVLAAGGTGGHVFPAIAIADALRDSGKTTHLDFIGTRDKMEWVAVPKAGYPIHHIWISGFHRSLTIKNLLFPFKLVRSLLQTRKILKTLKPDLVVACGGYVSGPVGYVAAKMGIPVILQEQNSFPGVTNRMLASKAQLIFTAFKQADEFFPKEKTRLLGNPTRKTLSIQNGVEAWEHFGFQKDRPTLLILGGSLGAKAINDAMVNHLDTLHNELGLQIIWQCGTRYYESIVKQVDIRNYDRLRLESFLENMSFAYQVSDLVISRSGASSCAELLVTGKPSVLVPSPHVAGDHQTANAKAMTENGASLMIKDDQLDAQLIDTVKSLVGNPEKLKEMSSAALSLAKPDAAKEIAREVIRIIDLKRN